MQTHETYLSAVGADFERRMVQHLENHFPLHCEQMGTPAVRRVIARGIQRAMSYHINGDADVCRFIDLMFAFGWSFELGEEFSWSRKILEDVTLASHVKIRQIYSRAHSLYKYHRSR